MNNQNIAKLRIIVIDDNPAIHQDFIKILIAPKAKTESDAELNDIERSIFGAEKSDIVLPEFEIDTASQGKEGVQMIDAALKDGRPYALAFVDIRMPPGWDGVETIKHIWELDNNIQVVICTAYSDYTWEETVEELGQRDNLLILKKPFDNISVRQLAVALTKKWQLLQESKHYTASLEERIDERTTSLQKSISLMRATLESSADGVLVIGMDNKISDNNKKFAEMWKIPNSIFEADSAQILLEFMENQTKEGDSFHEKVGTVLKDPHSVIVGEINFKDGRIFEYYTQPYVLNDEVIGRVWSFSDITKRASLEHELQYQATHDLLTGLPNRVLLLDRTKQAIAAAERHHSNVGILFLDLDRFKLINDSFSHDAGDKLLSVVAERLSKLLREEDTLSRIGGDEFVVVVSNIQDDTQLIDVARKLISIFDTPFDIQDHDIKITTSIGISCYPRDGKNFDILLRNADSAMYHAKELGANQYQFYTEELNQKNLMRLEQESELRTAIEENEFFLSYQPQFDLNAEKLVSVEALIRWRHPTKGVILPLDFIPLAEETGLIYPIGEWVLRTACNQIKYWQSIGLPHIRVAVNITSKQLRLYNLKEVILDILEDVDLDPQYLELELTENIIINNMDVIKTVHDLKKTGVQIVLDDFGTGYSSLSYLRELPVDRLKIDQSYVQNIASNRGDDAIIQAIIAMANNLNMQVLAEGVETQNQLEFLRGQNCGEAQGFYFSKPITPEECEVLLKRSNDLDLSKMIETSKE